MFLDSFKITGLAVTQIFLLGAIGYFLVKRNILGQDGLNSLSRLVIEITLPIMIFCQLVKGFSFTLYPQWWIFPLISMAITALGLVVGAVFVSFIKGAQHKLQFLSLVTFQNSGYLPLALVAALLPEDRLKPMFIYIFLFLLGFNLVIWSLGIYMLTFHQNRRFESRTLKVRDLFSPPVIAILFTLLFIFLGLDKIVPEFIFKPLKMAGDCTLPLAMFVVGGNLAEIQLVRVDKKAIFLMVLAKLIILPLLGLVLIMKFKLSPLLGLLILIELAMPPATSLSVIIRHYKKEDLIISQGVFFGHIASLIIIPIFLSLYFILSVVK